MPWTRTRRVALRRCSPRRRIATAWRSTEEQRGSAFPDACGCAQDGAGPVCPRDDSRLRKPAGRRGILGPPGRGPSGQCGVILNDDPVTLPAVHVRCDSTLGTPPTHRLVTSRVITSCSTIRRIRSCCRGSPWMSVEMRTAPRRASVRCALTRRSFESCKSPPLQRSSSPTRARSPLWWATPPAPLPPMTATLAAPTMMAEPSCTAFPQEEIKVPEWSRRIRHTAGSLWRSGWVHERRQREGRRRCVARWLGR